jgi:hypothetical protein
MGAAGWGAGMDGRPDQAVANGKRAIAIAAAPTELETFPGWFSIAQGHFHAGRQEDAWDAVQSMIDAATDSHHYAAIATGMGSFVAATIQSDQVDELVHQARSHAELARSSAVSAFVEHFACRAAFSLGQLDRSRELAHRAYELASESGAATVESSSLMNLALCTTEDGSDPARSQWASTLTHLHEFGNWTNVWTALEGLAADWAERGLIDQAATIIENLRRHGMASPSLAARRERTERALEQRTDFEPSDLHRDEIVAYALQQLQHDPD